MPEKNPAVLDHLSRRMSHPAKVMTGPAPARDEVMAILAAATRVPDHGKLEPWRLVVIEKPAMARLAALAEARARELLQLVMGLKPGSAAGGLYRWS